MVHPKQLVCIRMQLWNIHSQNEDKELGSLIFSNSFLQIEAKNHINLSENVPFLQAWHTDHFHYSNTRVPIHTEKNLNSEEHFGERVKGEFYEDIVGFLPLQEVYVPLLKHDLILYGKLSFYEKGFIYTDLRMGAFVVPFASLHKITFHVTESDNWI